MENKFYIDDFERFLKDKVEDFKMYPSHRVWHSIYNNMHPGSRWPSVSMCITLICTLFLIGYLNTGTTKRTTAQAQAKKETITISTLASNSKDKSADFSLAGKKPGAASANLPASNLFYKQSPNNLENRENSVAVNNGSETNNAGKSLAGAMVSANITNAQITSVENAIAINQPGIKSNKLAEVFDETATNTIVNDNTDALILAKNIYRAARVEKNKVTNNNIAIAVPAITPLINETISSKSDKPTGQLSVTEKSWIESYAMYNRPAPKKWKGKLSMQVYFTPSVVYRNLKNTAGKNASQALAASVNTTDIENFVTHTPSFGLETGTVAVYDLFKNVKIKGGVQFNYTKYNIHAYDNYHPTLTSLTMNNDNNGLSYETYRGSTYANSYGVDAVKLHSQTYQLSIPLGVDLRLAAVDNIEWYAGATVQPSLVLGGSSYLLSSDTRNYVPGNEFLNRFNLNTGFETYLSFKTKNGYTWNIGPQFRKQIFSTSHKIYSIQERLVNYGIKFGISKKL